MRAVHGIRMLPMIWYVRRVEKACALRIGMILECNYSDVRRRRVWRPSYCYFIYAVYIFMFSFVAIAPWPARFQARLVAFSVVCDLCS